MSLAHGIANEEEQQGEEDTQSDLMQAHKFNLHGHGYAINKHTADHGSNSTILISLRPEEAENQYPEEGSLHTAEGKHIDLPNYCGWIDRDSIDDQA